MHRATPQFWARSALLPQSVQESVRRNFPKLKADPRCPSLRLKKVGDYWSVWISRSQRALAVEDGEDFICVWIGGHEEYYRVIGS